MHPHENGHAPRGTHESRAAAKGGARAACKRDVAREMPRDIVFRLTMLANILLARGEPVAHGDHGRYSAMVRVCQATVR